MQILQIALSVEIDVILQNLINSCKSFKNGHKSHSVPLKSHFVPPCFNEYKRYLQAEYLLSLIDNYVTEILNNT